MVQVQVQDEDQEDQPTPVDALRMADPIRLGPRGAVAFQQLLQALNVGPEALFARMNGVQIDRENDPDGHVGGKEICHRIHSGNPSNLSLRGARATRRPGALFRGSSAAGSNKSSEA